MANRIQYQPAAPGGRYKPQQVDDRNIARMKEEAARRVEGMQRVARADLQQRQANLEAMQADAASTARANERNFRTATANSQRYLKGLQSQQSRDAQQFGIDQDANAAIFNSLASVSKSAGVIASTLIEEAKKKKKEQEERDAEGKETQEQKDAKDIVREQGRWALTTATTETYEQANIAGQQNANPLAVEKIKAEGNHAQNVNYTEAGLNKVYFQDLPFLWEEYKKKNNLPTILTAEQTIAEYDKFQGALAKGLGLDRFSSDFTKTLRDQADKYQRALIGQSVANDIKVSQSARRERAKIVAFDLQNDPRAAQRKLTDVYTELLDVNNGDRAKTWDDITSYFEEVDEKGEPVLPLSLLENFSYEKDGKIVTFGQEYGNKEGGRLDKIRENLIKNKNAQLKLIRDTDNLRAFQDEEEAIRIFVTGKGPDKQGAGTEALAKELVQGFQLKNPGVVPTKLNYILEHLTVEARTRQNALAAAEKLRDFELTPQFVNGLCRTVGDQKCKPVMQRLQAKEAKFKGTSFTKDQQTIISGVSGKSTVLDSDAGERPMIVHLQSKHRDLIDVYMAAGMTFEAASAKAADDVVKEYKANYRNKDPKNPYYRKVHRNGTVSYPYLAIANASAATQAGQRTERLLKAIKDLGGVDNLLKIPHAVSNAERLAYVKQNYNKPGFTLSPDEIVVRAAAKNLPTHEFFNRLFEAAGDPTRFSNPLTLNGAPVNFEQGDLQTLYSRTAGPAQKDAVLRRLIPGYYGSQASMRPGSPVGQVIAPSTNAIVTDPADGRGGTDAVFQNGERGAKYAWPVQGQVLKVVNDRPTEYRLEEGATQRDFGNHVEIRFTLPTGREVDVLVAHFDEVADLKPGDIIAPNTFIGTQGRSGSTTGAHVSFDFYEKGTNTPDSEARDWFLKNYLR